MRDILLVFGFTLKDQIKKKAFIISTVIITLLVVAICAIPAVMDAAGSGSDGSGQDDQPGQAGDITEKSRTCYYIDEAQAIPGAREALAAALTDISVVECTSEEKEAKKAKIKEDASVYMIEIAENEGKPFVKVYTKDFMTGTSPETFTDIIESVYVSNMLAEYGVDAATSSEVLSGLQYSSEMLGTMDLSGYVVGLLLVMLVFFAIYFYGYGVAMSVATEKTSRVIETLVVSTKPRNLLLGKCMGMGALGLIQMSIFLVTGAVCYNLMVPADFTIMGMPLAFSAFTPASAVAVVLYFLFGYALYAMINSVCGATVNRMEETSSALMPVTALSLISFYAAYFSIFMGAEMLPAMKTVVSYIPFTSAFIMPFRLLNETVGTGEVIISLALLAVSIVLVGAISVKIYTNSVLHYGGKMKLKDAYKADI